METDIETKLAPTLSQLRHNFGALARIAFAGIDTTIFDTAVAAAVFVSVAAATFVVVVVVVLYDLIIRPIQSYVHMIYFGESFESVLISVIRDI